MTAPIRDLALLHAVIAHARANGWTHDSTKVSGLPLEHRWMRGDDEVNVWGARLDVNDTTIWPASVRQAVNLLVDLDVLPVTLHSAYAEAQAEIADLTAQLDTKIAIIKYADEREAAIAAEIERNEARYVARGEEIVRLRAQLGSATEEPDRTLTAVELDAEQYIAPVGVAEEPVTEARIAQALEHIAAGRAVVWPAAGAEEPWKDPNYEVTDAEWQVQIEREAEQSEDGDR